MSVAMVLKIFSDCCICFAILGLAPVSFSVPLLIPALLYGVSAGIAAFFEEKGWSALRRLCVLLPWGCLFFADNGPQVFLLSVPAAYTTLVILCNKLELEYYAYRRFFLQSLALVGGAYLAVNAWIFLVQITNDTMPVLNPDVILRYGLVHLLCGIVLQRQLRLGVGYHAEGGRRQMATLLTVAATIIFGFVAAEPLLRRSLGTVLGTVLSVIAAPILLLVELIGWLVEHADRKESDKQTYEAFLDYMESIGLSTGEGSGEVVQRPVTEGINLNDVWIVLIVALMLIATVMLIKSFQKRRGHADTAEIVSRVITTPKNRKSSVLSNRGRVRLAYRDFLRSEKNLGMKLCVSDTSQDVLERIHRDTDRDSAIELRQVYMAVRYDDRKNVTRSQVEQARRALKATRTKN